MLRSCPLAIAVLLGACSPSPLVEQDVSFLVPLSQARMFLPISGAQGGRSLVSRPLFDRLPPLTVSDEPDALYAALSTVSVRLDACFKEGRKEQACRPQVRLVLQPVFDSDSGPTTRDAGLHLFFSVTEAEVKSVVHGLSLMRTQQAIAVGAGLSGPHPGFEHTKWVDGARELLTPLLRPEKLVRVTAMNVHASEEAWMFSGLDISGDVATDLFVPTLPAARDGHVTSTGGRDAIAITLDPAPYAEPKLPTLLDSSVRGQASAAEVSAAVEGLLRIEDPAQHNPGTTDCASCHVVATTKFFLQKEAPGTAVASPSPSSDAYANSRNMRAFGYFFQAPSISPRVQREAVAGRADLSLRLEQ